MTRPNHTMKWVPAGILGLLLLVLQQGDCFGRRSASATLTTPDWAKHAVWYQIFPERFRNGDRTNDPAASDLIGSWPHAVPEGWRPSRWTGDWYSLQPWEEKDGKGFYFEVQTRRYGGDLQGVIDELDYLKDLGITAIYFNPLFQSPSSHKYDGASYHHIDKNFGPDPAGDERIVTSENPQDPSTWKWTSADRLFLKLIGEAHRRGIRVVIDGVFNHVGLRFWAFEDLLKRQRESPYRDWFTVKRWDDPSTPANEFDYEGWSGVRELPEIREDAEGPVRPFAEYVHSAVKRWMDPNGDGDPSDGIDGWRLDVAEKVNIRFWQTFRQWVKGINPQAYIVGEVWWQDWRNEKMYDAAPWLQGDAFDAVMNYRWAREAFRFFAGNRDRLTPMEFVNGLKELLADYPDQANQVLLNLYDSHDTDRFLSHILNGDLSYDHHVGLNDNRSYNIRKPGLKEIQTAKLMILFQMTCVGSPTIYYGSEAGMWGADDPDCRKPMVWKDMTFDDERTNPFGTARSADQNKFNEDMFSWYKKTIALRKSHEVLSTGSFYPLATDEKSSIVAFERRSDSSTMLVVLNNSWDKQSFALNVAPVGSWVRVFGDGTSSLDGPRLSMEIEPKSGMVFEWRSS